MKWIEDHPDKTQADVVEHFKTCTDRALVFTQSTLSHKVAAKAILQQRVHSNPTALSAKRACIVTRPDVEHALVLWVKHMEEVKRKTVTGPMLFEKRKRFEERFDVPLEEKLTGDGWVQSFCKTYVL